MDFHEEKQLRTAMTKEKNVVVRSVSAITFKSKYVRMKICLSLQKVYLSVILNKMLIFVQS